MKQLRKWKGLLFVLPSLSGVLLFYILPFLKSFVYCFTAGLNDRRFVGLAHFKTLFSNANYRLAMGNTLLIIGVALPSLCLLSLIIALLIEKQLAKRKWLQGLLLIPMALPAASLMLVWQDLFAKEGILNAVLGTHLDWLQSDKAPWIIIGLIIWKNLGYNVLLMIGTLLTMPKEYEEAAGLDGAGFFKIASFIKIPYLIPMLFFTVVISLSNCFKIFREVYLLQGDYPNRKLYLLQHFMNNHFAKLNYDLLTTAAFALYTVIFTIIFFGARWQQRYIRENG
ncbi:carbohydrate ABC transporter permease [Cellulosilyticum lentocellum]|uniref:ABC-type transporter, integral membrane subunit n=1 Tax=Cellulosilyticum lentocellum (strain ATCC 49066 / DSM 5427 / NCIMB 11756 / RHM5) TaxID=642492 RepID=F2JJ55_CELLD|nr:sugar ABC transporter permease [Cellulosilyticum lentocellum]ADZ84348.1 ABC-type transporter, integral membrane subunit [Cellulosilyticum lentocellum DSM 5427]